MDGWSQEISLLPQPLGPMEPLRLGRSEDHRLIEDGVRFDTLIAFICPTDMIPFIGCTLSAASDSLSP